jgi:hypothetical protein
VGRGVLTGFKKGRGCFGRLERERSKGCVGE